MGRVVPRDEAGVRTWLRSFGKRILDLQRRQADAYWNMMTGSPHESLDDLSAYEGMIWLDPAVRAIIGAWRKRVTGRRTHRSLEILDGQLKLIASQTAMGEDSAMDEQT